MRYVGIDLHKRSLTVCVIDNAGGDTFDRKIGCSQVDQILEFFEELGKFEAVIEASATYEWLWELLEPIAQRIVLAHPKKIRIIAESMKKTDRHDAYFLAWLLSQDSVPEASRPTPRQREYQHLVSHRRYLVQMRTKIRVQIRSILAARNLDVKALFTRKGREYVETLELPGAERFRVGQLLAFLDDIGEQIKTAERELTRFRREAAKEDKRNHDIVKSVPGCGDLISDIVLASLGDVGRFSSIQKVTAYSGLVPGFRESDKKRRELGITKEGPRILRWALVQAAWRATQFSAHWRSVYERIAKRRGKKKAIVAVARRLLGVIYTLLKNQSDYVEPVASNRRRRARNKKGKMAAASA